MDLRTSAPGSPKPTTSGHPGFLPREQMPGHTHRHLNQRQHQRRLPPHHSPVYEILFEALDGQPSRREQARGVGVRVASRQWSRSRASEVAGACRQCRGLSWACRRGWLFGSGPYFVTVTGPQVASRTRSRSSGKLARPYVCRLSILIRLTLPSTTPEFQGRVSPVDHGVVVVPGAPGEGLQVGPVAQSEFEARTDGVRDERLAKASTHSELAGTRLRHRGPPGLPGGRASARCCRPRWRCAGRPDLRGQRDGLESGPAVLADRGDDGFGDDQVRWGADQPADVVGDILGR